MHCCSYLFHKFMWLVSVSCAQLHIHIRSELQILNLTKTEWKRCKQRKRWEKTSSTKIVCYCVCGYFLCLTTTTNKPTTSLQTFSTEDAQCKYLHSASLNAVEKLKSIQFNEMHCICFKVETNEAASSTF